MKTSELALLVAAIAQAPHIDKDTALLFSTFMIAVACLAVWVERRAKQKKEADGQKETAND
jgi:hypothetical protein